MTTSAKLKPIEDDAVVTKLMDGTYDQQLDLFRDQIEEATAALRRAHAAMKAENTLVS